MKECGSKTGRYYPEPPDQWLYQMNHGDAISRVVGWVKAHTTAYSRSAFAVDAHGKQLTLKHMAVDLGWSHKLVWRFASEAEQEGLIRIEKSSKKEPGRIFLCAEIPKARRRKGELNSTVQWNYPPYLIEQIERLSSVERRRFESTYGLFSEWRKELLRDGVSELRSYSNQAEDSILSAFGLERKREEKRRIKKSETFKVEFAKWPDFVQYVQSEPDEVCTKPETGNVHSQPKAAKPAQTATPAKTSKSARRVLPDPDIKQQRVIEQTATTATPGQQQKQLFDLKAYPLTDAAITKRFAVCSTEYRGRIVRAALALQDPRINDKIIAQSVEAATLPNQRSAALYETTVPDAISAWLRDADRKTA
jgi:hypothetical protein